MFFQVIVGNLGQGRIVAKHIYSSLKVEWFCEVRSRLGEDV